MGLTILNVTKTFRSGRERVLAIDNLSLHIPHGQFVVIIGPNGSGKSTLMNLIGGQLAPDQGAITWTSENGAKADWTAVEPRLRNPTLARVFQDPTAGTVPELTVEAHFRLVLSQPNPSPFRHRLAPAAEKATTALLARIGLADRRTALVSELSAGQRQMLALALAVARTPAVMLLDEPTASLDVNNAASCMILSEELSTERKLTSLLVTHRLSDAVRFGDRLLIMREGKLVADYDRREARTLDPSALLRQFEFT